MSYPLLPLSFLCPYDAAAEYIISCEGQFLCLSRRPLHVSFIHSLSAIGNLHDPVDPTQSDCGILKPALVLDIAARTARKGGIIYQIACTKLIAKMPQRVGVAV